MHRLAYSLLPTVTGTASRRVAGFALADHLRTEPVADALANAVTACEPAPGMIYHSARGRRYTFAAYAALAGGCPGHTVAVPGRRAGGRFLPDGRQCCGADTLGAVADAAGLLLTGARSQDWCG